jgi:Tfp pilus assembly pilus retraction ATPase PilT
MAEICTADGKERAMTDTRNKVERILHRRFKNEETTKLVLRLIPISEMTQLDDEELRARVEKLLRTDEGIELVIAEMEGGTARRPKKIGGRKEPRAHVTKSTVKL